MVEFAVDGRNGSGYLAVAPSGRGPGVLVLHAWWGLTPFIREVADRLAEAGFVAFAPDLYHGRTAATVEQAEQLSGALNGAEAHKDIGGAIAYLRAHPGIQGEGLGAVGFSMGAAWALMLEEPITAIVVFYGTTSADDVTAQAAFQGHFAEHDPYEPAEDVRALEESIRGKGRDVTFYTYPGTGHWFFEADRPDAYDPAAARLAWERTVEFLRGRLG